jgi:hypothetical protein
MGAFAAVLAEARLAEDTAEAWTIFFLYVGLTGAAAKMSDDAVRKSASRITERGRMNESKASSSTLEIPLELEERLSPIRAGQVKSSMLRSTLHLSAERRRS